ncbi:uncharacterized protein LOC122393851 isoform X2 [Amphibalanus amphitrite]|uniref:uncharacterized protein LOC122393851 isoform X2 n=1 Tax=Amphibalanus amphitrite TaxID=1232801 RepID=UPI001C920E13|nr:uncharacterized protein LOC122393851 isoform X2 [Amphibalanus amphitrite]
MTNFVIRRSGVSFPKNILIQDGACNKPLDANKALLKALGATGAGAVIVGAVTGEVNTTWGRAKSQNIIQDQSQTSFIKQQQTNQLTVHEKVTSLTTEKQREPDQISFEENGAGPVPIQDATKTAGDTPQTNMKRTENLVSGQLAATTSCNDSLQVRPTVSAKSVMDSGALPIDFAIVHRPEDDWLTQDLIKIEAEKSVTSRRDCFSRETDEKVDASTGEELDTKNANDTLPGSASTTGSSSSWLAHAQTEIQASFQGLRDNVNDALRTVEDTARLVQENDVTLENVATTDRDCKCRSVRI